MPARIALVDDDLSFARYLSTLLGRRGYDVETYSTGDELLDALGSAHQADVVLLDVLMPGLTGIDTLRLLRANHPNLAVIMVSSSHAPATIVDAVRLGAVDYVIKPDDSAGLGEAALESAIRNVVEKEQLTKELARLRAQVLEEPDGTQVSWGTGPAMRRVVTMVERVASSDVSVLLSGESGVGKEVVARELHRRSGRRAHAFIKVNCAALPADLLESELFGHERGAFTGAQQVRVGKFEFAGGGTILLDEIGEMPLPLQAKLLHVLQDRELTRLGSNRPVPVDVRVVAATNRALDQMIRQGHFREDLYYRLQVIEIEVPPLRERADEIVPLAEFFLMRFAARYGRALVRLSSTLSAALVAHRWPGNVRELENVVKRFVILQDEPFVLDELRRAAADVDSSDVDVRRAAPVSSAPGRPPSATTEKLADVARRAARAAERDAIQTALDACWWNRRKAAERLGVSYKTLLSKMRECGVTAPE